MLEKCWFASNFFIYCYSFISAVYVEDNLANQDIDDSMRNFFETSSEWSFSVNTTFSMFFCFRFHV